MDFASILPNLGLGGEFLSPVGKEIEQATSESLVNPDWGLNMQICDQVRTRRLGSKTINLETSGFGERAVALAGLAGVSCK